MAGLQLNPIDGKAAKTSIGEFGRIYDEAKRRSSNYLAKRLGGTTKRINASQRRRYTTMTGSKDFSQFSSGRQLGTQKLGSTKDTLLNDTPLSSFAGQSGFGSSMHRHSFGSNAMDQGLPPWVSPRIPSIKRPGRDLPDHWPTSPVSRERTQMQFTLRSRLLQSGCSEDDRQRELLRQRRVERKRAEDVAGYRAAFQLIDVDGSGQVCCARAWLSVGTQYAG